MNRFFLTAIAVVALSLAACSPSDEKAQEQAQGNTETTAVKEKAQYGKIKEVVLDPVVNKDMADKGEKIFDVSCTSCHKYEERYVGPPLGDVVHRRPPEYVMNMILDTETMIEKDDTVQCLLQEYLMKMPNMQVDEKDARNILEHLRVVGEKHKN